MNVRGRHSDQAGQPGAAGGGEPTIWTGQEQIAPGGAHPPVTVSGEDEPGDDLAAELAALAPRKVANRATLVLSGVVLVVVGFLGGMLAQREYGSSSSTTTSSRTGAAGFPGNGAAGGYNGFGNRQGAQPGASGAAGTRSGGGSTTGTVKMVDGSTVYIETADGQTITVKTSSSTTIQSAQASSLKDLAVGSTVTVEGSTDSGTITATKVTKG